MAAAPEETEREITGINVTPLVDVVLVLLIIFMVTAPSFMAHDAMEVDLPRAANAGEAVQGLLNLVLDKQGNTYLDGQQVADNDLAVRVSEAVGKNPDARAIISADQGVNYGRVMHLIDVVKGRGVTKFALNIQREESSAGVQP
jgi:biopolymer transport protein ExbD